MLLLFYPAKLQKCNSTYIISEVCSLIAVYRTLFDASFSTGNICNSEYFHFIVILPYYDCFKVGHETVPRYPFLYCNCSIASVLFLKFPFLHILSIFNESVTIYRILRICSAIVCGHTVLIDHILHIPCNYLQI